MQGTISKTLVIRFSSFGDIVLSTPILRTLRERFPSGRIDFLVRDDYAALLRGNPHLSEVLEFPRNGGLEQIRRLRETIRATGYDLILDLHGSLRSRLLCRGLRGVHRVRKRVFARFLLVRFKTDLYTLLGGAPGVTERYYETLREAGFSCEPGHTEVFPTPADISRASQVLDPLRGVSPIVGICPSARHFTKTWPAERFAEAAALIGKTERCGLLLFGSGTDAALCDRIAEGIRVLHPEARVLSIAGKLSLMETAAAMDRCDVLLTNDSGLMHLAAARRRKVVALFGSTVHQFGFFPPPDLSIVVEHHDLRCRPCSHIGRSSCPRGHFRCMLDITPERVAGAARALVGA